MVRHYNTSISSALSRQLNTKHGQHMTDEVDPIIKAVLPINDIANIVRSAVTIGASVTVFTTPADSDFFLTHLSIGSDGGAAASVVTVDVVMSGSTRTFRLAGDSAGGLGKQVSMDFTTPIRLDRNTAITLTSAALVNSVCNLVGFTVDTNKA